MADQGMYTSIDEEQLLEDEFYKESVVEIRVADEESTEEEESSHEVLAICEDCAHQWDDVIAAGGTEADLFCPLCGANRVMSN